MLAVTGLESPKSAYILVSGFVYARTNTMDIVRYDLISTNIQYETCM